MSTLGLDSAAQKKRERQRSSSSVTLPKMGRCNAYLLESVTSAVKEGTPRRANSFSLWLLGTP